MSLWSACPVVVDDFELEAVFQAMAQAGRVEQPGRGFIYHLPVSKGLTNLASVFQAQKNSVSIQQVVRAIDTLHGGTQWRANQLLVHDPRAREFASSSRCISKDLMVLNVVSQRKDSETLLQVFLEHGVSGASIASWRLVDSDSEHTQGGLRINREIGCITLVSSRTKIEGLVQVFRDAVVAGEMKSACCFTHCVPIVKTFSAIR